MAPGMSAIEQRRTASLIRVQPIEGRQDTMEACRSALFDYGQSRQLGLGLFKAGNHQAQRKWGQARFFANSNDAKNEPLPVFAGIIPLRMETKRDTLVKRLAVLAAATMMMLALGTGQAWATFAKPLKAQYKLSDTQTQLVFATLTLVFCLGMVPAGRLHDRWGPRPMAIASAVMVGAGYAVAWGFGQSFVVLWLAMGVLVGGGVATGYVCPIATAVKWFPHHKGLVCGLAAAGFGVGPVVLSSIAKGLLAHGWGVLEIYGLVAATYAPVILLCGLGLVRPGRESGDSENRDRPHFQTAKMGTVPIFAVPIFGDGRFWLLFAGMLCGTMPFLIVMGNVEVLGGWFGVGVMAALGVPVVAVGNTAGRLFWGRVLDRLGQRRAMLASQTMMLAAVVAMLAFGGNGAVFLAAAAAIGFCYGSNFAIFPATVAALYGAERMGTVYSWVMAAQGISSLGSIAGGHLFTATGSYYPGLGIGAVAITCGLVLTLILSKRLGLR